MASFDLISQQWIPVTHAGRRIEVGLLDALTGAREFDGLALDDPLEAVAVLRQVLLPVVLDACGAPRDGKEWASRWDSGRLDGAEPRIARYLKDHADHFDLFHPTMPFAQVAGLHTAKDETKPVSLLIPRLAAGNNVPLFSARTERDPPWLAPGAAARALLAAHCWDTAAIKSGAVGDAHVKAGKTTGNPTGPLGQLGVVVPLGETLFHTLMLNVPVLPQGLHPRDRPQWRDGPAGPGWRVRGALGQLDLLTWQSRRIRLIPEPDAASVGGVAVRRVVLSAGDRLDGSVHDIEPHTAWRQVQNPSSKEPSNRAVRHQPGRSAWRGLDALLATRSPTKEGLSAPALLEQLERLRDEGHVSENLPLRVLTVGVRYGNQSAVIEDVMADETPLPVTALARDSAVRDAVLLVADQADKLRGAANRLDDDLRAAGGGDKVPWDKSQRLGDLVVYSFTPVVRRLLAGLARHPDQVSQAEDAWRLTARRIVFTTAEPALSSAAPGTFLGPHPDELFSPCVARAEASFQRAVKTTLG